MFFLKKDFSWIFKVNKFSSVAQLCPTLRPHGLQHTRPPCPSPTPRAYSNSRDAIQPSHPLSSPSPAFNLSHHQDLFKWLSSSHQVAQILEFQLQHQSFQLITGHGTTDWFQIGKGVRKGCILSPCLFNLYAEYIMRNAGRKKHKMESRLLGEISITSDMQMTPPLWQKVKTN